MSTAETTTTPGPWQVSQSYDVTGYPCYFIHGMSGHEKRDVPTLAANARLMAAAPEMLAALECVVRWMNANGYAESDQSFGARAAIAKAKGLNR